MTKPTTRLNPDELLTHLHHGLAVLGLGELRRALDETLAEPTKDESRLAWLWRLIEPQLRLRLESRAERRIQQPQSCEPRRNLRPRVASPNKWARMEAVLRNRSFIDDYAEARARWRDGIATAFPPGTYWLQRFAAVPIHQA